MVLIVRVMFPELCMTARSIEKVFGEEGQGVEWTVVRVVICGGGEESRRMRREDEINVRSFGDAC
jgi:hypothetical protein